MDDVANAIFGSLERFFGALIEPTAGDGSPSVSSVSPYVGPSTGDGEISEGEIRIALRQALGAEPSPFLVSNARGSRDATRYSKHS